MLEQVYAFLDHELDPAQCPGRDPRTSGGLRAVPGPFDVEVMVKSLIQRSCGSELAPADLRADTQIIVVADHGHADEESH